MEISKKQQFINECREAMEKDNAGVTMFIQMPTGEEELIHNPNLAAKLDYIEWAYDDDLHLKSCPEIRINEYHIHIPQEEVMDFGVALMNLKEGRRVARKGWNGKGQYLELATDISYTSAAGQIINCEHAAIGNKAIAFVGTSGVQMGWLASQADMLAEDWIIL